MPPNDLCRIKNNVRIYKHNRKKHKNTVKVEFYTIYSLDYYEPWYYAMLHPIKSNGKSIKNIKVILPGQSCYLHPSYHVEKTFLDLVPFIHFHTDVDNFSNAWEWFSDNIFVYSQTIHINCISFFRWVIPLDSSSPFCPFPWPFSVSLTIPTVFSVISWTHKTLIESLASFSRRLQDLIITVLYTTEH